MNSQPNHNSHTNYPSIKQANIINGIEKIFGKDATDELGMCLGLVKRYALCAQNDNEDKSENADNIQWFNNTARIIAQINDNQIKLTTRDINAITLAKQEQEMWLYSKVKLLVKDIGNKDPLQSSGQKLSDNLQEDLKQNLSDQEQRDVGRFIADVVFYHAPSNLQKFSWLPQGQKSALKLLFVANGNAKQLETRPIQLPTTQKGLKMLLEKFCNIAKETQLPFCIMLSAGTQNKSHVIGIRIKPDGSTYLYDPNDTKGEVELKIKDPNDTGIAVWNSLLDGFSKNHFAALYIRETQIFMVATQDAMKILKTKMPKNQEMYDIALTDMFEPKGALDRIMQHAKIKNLDPECLVDNAIIEAMCRANFHQIINFAKQQSGQNTDDLNEIIKKSIIRFDPHTYVVSPIELDPQIIKWLMDSVLMRIGSIKGRAVYTDLDRQFIEKFGANYLKLQTNPQESLKYAMKMLLICPESQQLREAFIHTAGDKKYSNHQSPELDRIFSILVCEALGIKYTTGYFNFPTILTVDTHQTGKLPDQFCVQNKLKNICLILENTRANIEPALFYRILLPYLNVYTNHTKKDLQINQNQKDIALENIFDLVELFAKYRGNQYIKELIEYCNNSYQLLQSTVQVNSHKEIAPEVKNLANKIINRMPEINQMYLGDVVKKLADIQLSTSLFNPNQYVDLTGNSKFGAYKSNNEDVGKI